MTNKWPSFETRDIPEPLTDEGDAEMHRRWEVYEREMKALIAAGIAHQDDDGWWIETATGELLGPDPEIERPWAEEDFGHAKPLTFTEAFPDLDASIKRTRGAQAAGVAIPVD